MPSSQSRPAPAAARVRIEALDDAVVRFAGDVSDGMHLAGVQFARVCAEGGNIVWTRPDPPSEIRAPAGSLAGVAALQVRFAREPIHTPGDRLSALVAMNPAALRANLPDLASRGLLIVNSDAFTQEDWLKVGYAANPLSDGSLSGYQLVAVPMNELNRDSARRASHNPRETERSKCFFPLGLVCWVFDKSLEPIERWVRDTYSKNPAMIDAATRSLRAGYDYGPSAKSPARQRVDRAEIEPGAYRLIDGAEAVALGLLCAAHQAERTLVFASAGQPPASELLHRLCEMKQPNVRVLHAEDDPAAINLALGSAFGGGLGVTASCGPGLSLQSETLSLAVMCELPCVEIHIQRAGPSTGMPTKTEQADLFAAVHGRTGECPLIVLAPASPADGFEIIREALRLAVRCMSPVIVLVDASLLQIAEPWRVPSVEALPAVRLVHDAMSSDLHARDTFVARPWVIPGVAGREHRSGGLEKDAQTGHVSFEGKNHQAMIELRARKIAQAAEAIEPLSVLGPTQGELLVLGWGSTYGAIAEAVAHCRKQGRSVAQAHLRNLHPMPANTLDVLKRYRKVLVPELNAGQLRAMLRAAFGIVTIGLNRIEGRPLTAAEIVESIESLV